MNNVLALGQRTETEFFSYFANKHTYEKIILENKTVKWQKLRTYKQYHNIEINYDNKTISINGVLFHTQFKNGYVYKKLKGDNIGCTSFNELVKHIKESAEPKSVFNLSTFEVLKSISKKANYIF